MEKHVKVQSFRFKVKRYRQKAKQRQSKGRREQRVKVHGSMFRVVKNIGKSDLQEVEIGQDFILMVRFVLH